MNVEDYLKILPIEECAEYDRQTYHKHDNYEIIWLTEVDHDDTIQIDFCEYPITVDNFFFISATQLHRLDRTGKKGVIISMSRDFFLSIVSVETYARSSFSINSIINQQKCHFCRSIVELILTEYRTERRLPLFEAYFKALFIHLGPVMKQNDCKGDRKQAASLLDLVEENFRTHKDVKFYAEQMGLSEKSVSDIARKTVNKPLKQIIQDRLLLEIKREIAAGNMNFKELSWNLGFSEPSYFSRFFKKQTGQTPEEFKAAYDAMSE